MKNILIQILNIYRLLPVWLMILLDNNKELIFDEIDYWNSCTQMHEKKRFNAFSKLLLHFKEYRNLLAFRICGGRGYILRILFPPMETLYINTREIGPRLFIQHGFATCISAKSIGSDCWINQQVTIGYTFDPEPPVIGNGVRISAGAKVIGQIHLGDNCIVAANAAVVKDVAENEIVGGVPSRVIGKNTEHQLYKK